MRRSGTRAAGISPLAISAAAAALSKKLAAYSTSPRLSTIGLPLSAVTNAARLTASARIPAARRRHSSTRFKIESARIPRAANAFASAARALIAAEAPRISAITAFVAGLRTTTLAASPKVNAPPKNNEVFESLISVASSIPQGARPCAPRTAHVARSREETSPAP